VKHQARIAVKKLSDGPPLEFTVTVQDDQGQTRHAVTVSAETAQAWKAAGYAPEQCVGAAFRFLLDREPKESILSRFDVNVISRYFPEFERELPRYLPHPGTG